MIKTTTRAVVMALLLLSATGLEAGNDLEQHRSCEICGMDRKAYGYSRMLIQYEDGAAVAVCSLHCAAQALSDRGTAARQVLVADRNTRVLIDAAGATWVVGGNKRGVMTKVPKWAFGTTGAAEAFIGSNGGKMVAWEAALSAARDELVRKDQ